METDIAIPIDIVLADLCAEERGFVLGTLLTKRGEAGIVAAASTDDPGEPASNRCREAVSAIAALPRTERLRWIGLLAREALAPLPRGIEDVQEDVLVETLEAESVFVIRLIAAQQGPAPLRRAAVSALRLRQTGSPGDSNADPAITTSPAPDVVAELQRAVFARIAPVPPAGAAAVPRRLGRRLATMPVRELLAEVTRAGADLLGTSLRGADDATLKRAIAHAGAPWSDDVADAARGATSDVDAAPVERARRLAAAVAPATEADGTLARLGARQLGDRLGREDPDLIETVAQRLPADLRRELLAAAAAAAAAASG